MTFREIYLDNNASTRPLPEVVQAMLEAMGPEFGNPSSAHSAGDRARGLLERSREAVAELIGAEADHVAFTSGGTEGNNLVLQSVLKLPPERRRVVTTTVEHSSVLKMCEYLESQGVEVARLDVDRDGLLPLDKLAEELRRPTGLVSVQWVNSETGVIQPIEAIGALCGEAGALFHTDAAQAVGKLPVSVASEPIDFLTFTGHKLHAPQGTGAIYWRNRRQLLPAFHGGSQESGVRAGTENLPGIAGLGEAARLRVARFGEVTTHLSSLRDAFERQLQERLPRLRLNGHPDRRVCNSTNLLFEGTDGQAVVARLDVAGIRCSQSSACTNMRPEPSYVLRAMGLTSDEAYSSVRFSFSEVNTREEIDQACSEIVQAAEAIRGARLRLSASH